MMTRAMSEKSGVCQVPTPSTQVATYTADLMATVKELEDALANHANKLAPVLMPNSPANAKEGEAPDVLLCPVADRIRTTARIIQGITHRVRDLTERTEA